MEHYFRGIIHSLGKRLKSWKQTKHGAEREKPQARGKRHKMRGGQATNRDKQQDSKDILPRQGKVEKTRA
eukprot:6176950-Pleurochrysis_carterae.AAC.1